MLFEIHGVCGQVSGAGSLIKLHFRDTPLVDYRSARPVAIEEQAFARLFVLLLENGVFATPTGFMCLSTVMGEGEIDLLIGAIDVALERMAGELTL